MSDATKLLPCPFCGSKPKFWSRNENVIFCACEAGPEIHAPSKAQSIAAWNRRAPADALAAAHEAYSLELQLHGASKITDAIAALPAVTVGVQERVQHKKRGSTYRVLGRGLLQTDMPLTDYSEVVVYQGEADGLVWARPVTEFDDGRFAALEPVAAPDLTDPVTVHANMLRGTIAKPTVEQIIHLYGVDTLVAALAPVIVREAGIEPS